MVFGCHSYLLFDVLFWKTDIQGITFSYYNNTASLTPNRTLSRDGPGVSVKSNVTTRHSYIAY